MAQINSFVVVAVVVFAAEQAVVAEGVVDSGLEGDLQLVGHKGG